MFGKKGAKVLQEIELLPRRLKDEELLKFLENFEVKHPECGRVVKAVVVVKRVGKGRTYLYARLKHVNPRKASGIDYCYEPLPEGFVA